MYDLKVNISTTSKKARSSNTWTDIDADKYLIDGQLIFKLYVTRHDFEHAHFNIDEGIIQLGEDSYLIKEVTYEKKRPKYANCIVEKECS